MFRFAIRRLFYIPLLLILVNFLGFSYAHYAGPLRAERTPYILAVDAGPLLPAYTAYIIDTANLNFGMKLQIPGNTRSNLPMTFGEMLIRAIIASFGLLAISLCASVILGFSIGFRAVRNEPPSIANWLTPLTTIGLAMPSFYIGSLLILSLVAIKIWYGPETAVPLPLDGYGWDLHLVLPVLALMARPTLQLATVTAEQLSGELGKQYAIAARSFGHTWRSLRNRYALRNVIAPVVLTISAILRVMVGEQVLIEWLFRWPGLGRLLAWTLVPARLTSSEGSPLFLNPPVMASVITLIAALFLIGDFISAVLVRTFDPRSREVEGEKGLVVSR